MLDTGTTAPNQTPEKLFDNIYEDIPKGVSVPPSLTTPYTIKYENWYKTIPYALRIVSLQGGVSPSALISGATGQSPTEGATPMHFFFPVNPESISINTPFATVVTPTIGGIVQEHSGAVFYNISISGTTGVIPDLNFTTGIPRNANTDLRPLGGDKPTIPNFLGGFGASTIGAINSAVSAITGTSPKMVGGDKDGKSGYTAFHVLYKFIWLYHFAKANGAPQQLRFMNYKDNNQYDCVVTNFNLSRDKGRPHLYQYTIQLKAWKLSTANQQPSFLNKTRLSELGLNEGPSLKAEAFRAINTAKTVLNTAAGLLNAVAQDAVI